MIESIHLSGVVTYEVQPEIFNELSKFDFVYGSIDLSVNSDN